MAPRHGFGAASHREAGAPGRPPPMQSAATTRCDTDLAPYVGASLEVMARESPPTDPRTHPPRVPDMMASVWDHNGCAP